MKKNLFKTAFLFLLLCLFMFQCSIVLSEESQVNQLQEIDYRKTMMAIAVTDGYSIAVKDDGTVMVKGSSSYGEDNVGEWRDIVGVDIGNDFTVGLKKDGTVVAVGRNNNGQCDTGDWKNIIDIAAGDAYTVGLKSDGTVVATGSGFNGTCNIGDWENIIDIAASDAHTVGLKADGTVVAVGHEYEGELNVGSWNNIVAVAAGNFYTIGLRADGTVVAVGKNENNQCNVSNWRDIVAITSTGSRTIGIKKDGTLISTGRNFYNECNLDEFENIVAVSGDDCFTVAVKADGTVMCKRPESDMWTDYHDASKVDDWKNIGVWTAGNIDWEQIIEYEHDPALNDISGMIHMQAIAAGDYHTVGLKADGTVIATGKNNFGQCDVSEWKNIVAVVAGKEFTIGLKADGTIEKAGNENILMSDYSLLNRWTDIVSIKSGKTRIIGIKKDGSIIFTDEIGTTEEYNTKDIVDADIDRDHFIVLNKNGTVMAEGRNAYKQCDVTGWKDIVAIATSQKNTVGLKADGTVVAAGTKFDGLQYLSGWKDIVAIEAESDGTIGIKKDGSVIAFGPGTHNFAKVNDWEYIVGISIGEEHTVGLKADGTVVAVGKNEFGQCNVDDWKLVSAVPEIVEKPKKKANQTEITEASATAVPVPATAVPVPATAVPVPATAVPVPATAVPVPATAVPVLATAVPVPATAVPVPATPVPVPVKIPVNGMEDTYEYIPQYASGNSYVYNEKQDFSPAMVIDGDETTSWQFSTKNISLGDVSLEIALESGSIINEMWIKNGFWRITNNLDQYTRNGRPKKIAISFLYDGESEFCDEMEWTLRDDKERRDWQIVSLGHHENVSAVRIRILSIYTGTKFKNDVAISEIKFVEKENSSVIVHYETLKKGSKGDDVLTMKLRLQELGYFKANADVTNVFNDTCVERVKQFQKKNGLRQTGIADHQTLALLYSDSAISK